MMVNQTLNLGTLMAKRKDWQAQVKGLLKAELKRRNLSYADLAGKLAAVPAKWNTSPSATRWSFNRLPKCNSKWPIC